MLMNTDQKDWKCDVCGLLQSQGGCVDADVCERQSDEVDQDLVIEEAKYACMMQGAPDWAVEILEKAGIDVPAPLDMRGA